MNSLRDNRELWRTPLKKFRALSDKPLIGPLVRKAVNYAENREVHSIAKHFSKYLQPVMAHDEVTKKAAFNIRHQVYCEELGLEPVNLEKQEKDEFDDYSIHSLIKHLPPKTKSIKRFIPTSRSSRVLYTPRYAGTVRVVRPEHHGEIIPLQKYCLDTISPNKINPQDFPPHEVCEISRLAVPVEFRRRQNDKFEGAATGLINQQTYSEAELRCFPFIAIGLYLTGGSIILENKVPHAFAMMEPRLARGMRFVGIQFEKIGPTVDYHGKRAPYYIEAATFIDNLNPGFKMLLKNIRNALNHTYEI